MHCTNANEVRCELFSTNMQIEKELYILEYISEPFHFVPDVCFAVLL